MVKHPAQLACCSLILASVFVGAAFAASSTPLPRPRPADAPKLEQNEPEKQPNEKAAEKPAPQPSACRLALTDAIAIAPSLPPITGPGACGGDDIVRLEAVVLPDKRRVALKPAATLRCQMATAIAEWVRGDIAAIAAELGTAVSELDNFDSFDCRGRNRVAGARMSEHGRANALDMRGIKFVSGQAIALTDRTTARELREKVKTSVCARFTTVLGPGSDWYHEDHVHVDLAERRSGYRICQWEVWDSLPQVAPLLPALRPEDAPPRESAEEKSKPEEQQKAVAPEQAKPAASSSQPPSTDAMKDGKQPKKRTKSSANKKGAGIPAPFAEWFR